MSVRYGTRDVLAYLKTCESPITLYDMIDHFSQLEISKGKTQREHYFRLRGILDVQLTKGTIKSIWKDEQVSKDDKWYTSKRYANGRIPYYYAT